MSELAQDLLGGIQLGGRQTQDALEMALAIDNQPRRRVLEELRAQQGRQRLSDEQRQSQWATEDRPSAVRARDLHLGDLEAEHQSRVEALASRHADQRYHAWDAERMGMFNSPDPETGAMVGDPQAYTEFHQMDPATQAAAVAAQRATVQKQQDWQARERIANVRSSYQERALQEKVGQIWAANKRGLIDDAERERRLDEALTTGHVSPKRFEAQEDPRALHDKILAGGGTEEQAKAAALQATAKRGGASPSLFNLPKNGAGVVIAPEDFEANRGNLSPRLQSMLEPYVTQGKPVPATIMAMAHKPEKQWNQQEQDLVRAETAVKDATDRYKRALKGYDKAIATKGGAKSEKMMAPILQAENAKRLAEVARDAAHDAAMQSHQWKPAASRPAAAPAAPAPGRPVAAAPAPAGEPSEDAINRAFDELGDGADTEAVRKRALELDSGGMGDER